MGLIDGEALMASQIGTVSWSTYEEVEVTSQAIEQILTIQGIFT